MALQSALRPAKAQWSPWVIDVSAEVAANLELLAANDPLMLSEHRRRDAPHRRGNWRSARLSAQITSQEA